MKYLITDNELLDYVSGEMDKKSMRDLEAKAFRAGKTDLLLYAQLADYAATGTSTDDIIGEDTFMLDVNYGNNVASICIPKVASQRPPQENDD